MAHKPVARVGDLSSGHGCYPPRPCVQGSPNVWVNGRQAQIIGARYADHCCDDACHNGYVTSGTNRVLINNTPTSRIGDSISCGDVTMTASEDVFVGE